MIFVPYDRFKNVNFIAEGGFSKIYKAIWIDGPIRGWSKKNQYYTRVKSNYDVVLKRLNNSKDITSKELNELVERAYIFDRVEVNNSVSENHEVMSC
ncbi:21892_t:CDS:2 [Rhizophagus irregularis]|nr:21892_t:CDS:2 [Rhizophagus irregularis]